MNCIVIVCDTLRRDHCGPYHLGRPLNEVQSDEQPDWTVPTPNMDRLAERGTVFENAWCGSTPCAPARRDIYTGRYEFLERGWGPLEDGDRDLPREVSGPPNRSIERLTDEGYRVSQLVSDHFHLWERGMANYHTGYTGFQFVRGQESDNYRTDPVDFPCPDDRRSKRERHFRNVHLERGDESDYFAARVFSEAAGWLRRNHGHDDFYLHVDCFDPHEPWDPPEHLLERFDERGYDVDWHPQATYDEWREHYDADELRHIQACYAAEVTLVDRWLGELLDAMDDLGLWEDTVVLLTTDHGTFNGDRGRTGKLQTHEHDPLAHIPFVAYHPEGGHGERRDGLVQLVDIYPTVLNAVGRSVPENRHGRDLAPVILDPDADHREYAIAGQFGKSVTITDGDWILHQSPVEGNEPLYWHGHHDSKFMGGYDLGPYEEGRRPVDTDPWGTGTWLSDKRVDPNERENLAAERPAKLAEMQRALADVIRDLDAPTEQLDRLGIRDV